MIEALTLRGFEDPDTIKPDNRKSEDEKSLTEDRNPKSHSRRNLSKDHDRGSNLKTRTCMQIFGSKMNEHFPRPSDRGNHHGLGYQSFSVSNKFSQNSRCDALFDRVRHRKVLS